MTVDSLRTRLFSEAQLRSFSNNYHYPPKSRAAADLSSRACRASQEPLYDDGESKLLKQTGMFSLRKRIEDSILRVEMLAPTALEFEVSKHINQEEVIRDYNLWDDLSKSNEILNELAESAKVVDTLKDLTYKAEEAKLITELAETDAVNYTLLKQAYSTSLSLNNYLDKYELSKLLKEPYDMEGACIVLESRHEDSYSERWTGQLAQVYMKWAERQGYVGRIVESFPSDNGGLKSATIELEFKFAYGYLSGERGVHSMIRSLQKNSTSHSEACVVAYVDVIPLFIDKSPCLLIDDEDLMVSYTSSVHVRHLPTGLEFQSAGERSRFANKLKALNRLKAKLLVVMLDQGISSVENIKKVASIDRWSQITRKYVFRPNNMVHDLKSGVQFSDVNAVLNGNIDSLIAGHIHCRQSSTFI
ncbi:peptide chain release factor [Striga asiatica]|uniref:Peptide chain release factor n=1 Tax=Striga asiatica TaxID=4170 RepID=A0A5A7NZY3_STRAF|nr:peptide chain release factor [Striga asiatica]